MSRDIEVKRVREVIERLIRDGSVVARSDGSEHTVFPVAISPEEGVALREWVYQEGAVKTTEIGFGYGFSALNICEGLLLNGDQDAKHIVLDPNQATRFADCGLQALEDAGVRRLVDHYAHVSEIVLPQFLEEGRCFDFGFVDGNHRFEHVFLDLFYLGRLVRRGGIIMLDDYGVQGIKRAVAFYVNNMGWTVEDIVAGGHSVVVRTPEIEVERDFRDFVDF